MMSSSNAGGVSSFSKKNPVGCVNISGTRLSVTNNCLLTSTGIPSLDNLLGGGLIVGSLLIVEEDKFGSFAEILLKCFASEGVCSNHRLLLASPEVSSILRSLPCPADEGPSQQEQASASVDLNIAWRYKASRQQQEVRVKQTGGFYDLAKFMPEERLAKAAVESIDVLECASCEDDRLQGLLNRISALIDAEHTKRTVIRIGIHALGSPLWDLKLENFLLFVLKLRLLLRSCLSVCIMTIPSHLLHARELSSAKLAHLSDYSIALESFSGSPNETNPVFKDYHGLLHIKKLPTINTLKSISPPTFDLAFKFKRKKLVFEHLNLPPDLSETASRCQDDSQKKAEKFEF